MAGGVAVLDYKGDGRMDISTPKGEEIPSLRKTGPWQASTATGCTTTLAGGALRTFGIGGRRVCRAAVVGIGGVVRLR